MSKRHNTEHLFGVLLVRPLLYQTKLFYIMLNLLFLKNDDPTLEKTYE